MAVLRGFEDRLGRLENGGGCPECEDAREDVLEDIFAGGTDAPDNCPNCGRDVRPTVFDVDRLVDEWEGGA